MRKDRETLIREMADAYANHIRKMLSPDYDQSSLIDVAYIGIDKGTGRGLRIAAAALAVLDIREYEKK